MGECVSAVRYEFFVFKINRSLTRYANIVTLRRVQVLLYANEHEPKHIHVENASGFVKIELATLRVVNNHMKSKDLKKSLSIVEANKSNFERKWDEYFSQR